MLDMVQTMFWPFIACLLLAGIHVYLGVHVLARQVIFVDLALAQMAALGSVVASSLQVASKPCAIVMGLLGAALLSVFKAEEALIGVFYAVALSLTILFSAALPHGADEIRELLSGNILWVQPELLMDAAILYAVVGMFHWIFRKQFLQASFGKENVQSRIWDFAFYATFALVVTSSVEIAGVLLVFSFLVIPAMIAGFWVKSVQGRLCFGWVIGALVSLLGSVVSYVYDLPSGPAIVVCFGGCLLFSFGVKQCLAK